MKIPRVQRRTLALIAVIVPLVVLFVYVALRSGPLAPVAVRIATVQSTAIAPALSGIGTVQARYTFRIGPTLAARVKRLDVHVGDTVQAAQVLGEMDPVDLDNRIHAQQAAIKSAEAALRQADARQNFALTQASRYAQLLAARGTTRRPSRPGSRIWRSPMPRRPQPARMRSVCVPNWTPCARSAAI